MISSKNIFNICMILSCIVMIGLSGYLVKELKDCDDKYTNVAYTLLYSSIFLLLLISYESVFSYNKYVFYTINTVTFINAVLSTVLYEFTSCNDEQYKKITMILNIMCLLINVSFLSYYTGASSIIKQGSYYEDKVYNYFTDKIAKL